MKDERRKRKVREAWGKGLGAENGKQMTDDGGQKGEWGTTRDQRAEIRGQSGTQRMNRL